MLGIMLAKLLSNYCTKSKIKNFLNYFKDNLCVLQFEPTANINLSSGRTKY